MDRNVVGRASTSAIRLADAAASNEHASVFWSGERWVVRDLGSTNGTFADEIRCRPPEGIELARGSVIRFGSAAERWELVDERGPAAVARCVGSDEVRVAEDGLLALPDSNDVVVSIILEAGERWLVESADGTRRPAKAGEQLVVGDKTWELDVPKASSVTGTYEEKLAPTIASLALRFHVSRNEEHVRLEALLGERVLTLGERSSFYMLLQLARHRKKDLDEGVSDAEQGWYHIDDLRRALNVEERNLNVTVFRARAVFAKVVEDAERIIERRPRELRIGTARIEEIKS